MSSATRFVRDAFKRVVGPTVAKSMKQVALAGMSPRQLEMNRRWAYYTCTQYDNRRTGWDGTVSPTHLEHEVIASQGFIPPGFYDAGGAMNELPLKYRKPNIAYHLVKVAVDRFTGLLFSERRHPTIQVLADEKTEDYAKAMAEESRIWQAMIQARRYGGATGTAVVGFKFSVGKPVVEVHDPRWCTPVFRDRSALELASVEKRYVYPVEMQDENGRWAEVPHWYRRVIDEQRDVLYAPAPVGDGEEPDWVEQEVVDHNLGFCSAVWIQNLPVDDDIDGEQDCHGGVGIVENVDALLSQAFRGTVANCDPTLGLNTDKELDGVIKKGNGNAITLEKGGSAGYIEASMTGPVAARAMVTELRAYFLEVVQCVLEHPDTSARTATEVERSYSSMLSKADILREQYGQKGVLPLLQMMVRAAGMQGAQNQTVVLPPRKNEDTGAMEERELGDPEARLTIVWPGYFEPGLADAGMAATAVNTARLAGVLDLESAVSFAAPYFHADDVKGTLEKLGVEKDEQDAAMQSDLLDQSKVPAEGEKPPGGDESLTGMPDATVVAASAPQMHSGIPLGTEMSDQEIEDGIWTINEVRAARGVGPRKDGDLTVPEYRAKYPKVFSASAAALKPDLGHEIIGSPKKPPPVAFGQPTAPPPPGEQEKKPVAEVPPEPPTKS